MIPQLPLRDLSRLHLRQLPRELLAALAVTSLTVPQSVAYAIIAGLPPVTGLYASALPAIVGSLTVSSRHLVVGPTNSVSLLVGSAIALSSDDPLRTAITLAALTGALQLTAGLLRLGSMVDYISQAVVLGYITGAGVLIGAGQLQHATRSPAGSGHLGSQLLGWLGQLDQAHLPTVALTAATALGIVALRRTMPQQPATLWAMLLGTLASWSLQLGDRGLRLVGDLAPVPSGLPTLSWPDPTLASALLPTAFAAMLLSLVEASSVARALASRSGQRLDTSTDFVGLGLANLTAAFTTAYPVSGSLTRSVLNERIGASSRLAGALGGLLVLGVLLALGPLLNLTPIASLAGILLVMAADLVDVARIREVMAANVGDWLAFLTTLVATWLLPLDQAILLGVGISIVTFLRRVRHLVVRELVIDRHGHLRERDEHGTYLSSPSVKVLHVQGTLFFGAANELRDAIDDAMRDPAAKVLVLRLKRTQGMDLTAASVLLAADRALESRGQHLVLVGVVPHAMQLLERTGIADEIGRDGLFPSQPGWFTAMDAGLSRAVELAGTPADCPLRHYLAQRELERGPLAAAAS